MKRSTRSGSRPLKSFPGIPSFTNRTGSSHRNTKRILRTRTCHFSPAPANGSSTNAPFLQHKCYIMLTQKGSRDRKESTLPCSLTSSEAVSSRRKPLIRLRTQEFLDSAGQFERILTDSGFVKNGAGQQRSELAGSARKAGLLERYCFLVSRRRTSHDQGHPFQGWIEDRRPVLPALCTLGGRRPARPLRIAHQLR
jgi:hypothetical protein